MDLRTVRADWDDSALVWDEPISLTQADLVLLQEVPKETSVNGAIAPLKRLRERHHALARLLASGGTTMAEASIITGIGISQISILKNDPSFKELVLFYQNEVRDEYRTMHAQLAGLGEDAVAELRRRVEDDPESIGFTSLLDLVTKIADRTGHGPTSSTKAQVEVNVQVDLAAKMKEARMKARAAIEGSARDITPEASN